MIEGESQSRVRLCVHDRLERRGELVEQVEGGDIMRLQLREEPLPRLTIKGPANRRVVLTAPLRMARGTAVGFAETQAGWIAARLERLPARRPFGELEPTRARVSSFGRNPSPSHTAAATDRLGLGPP